MFKPARPRSQPIKSECLIYHLLLTADRPHVGGDLFMMRRSAEGLQGPDPFSLRGVSRSDGVTGRGSPEALGGAVVPHNDGVTGAWLSPAPSLKRDDHRAVCGKQCLAG